MVPVVSYRCMEGHVLTVDAGVDPRKLGCRMPRLVRNGNNESSAEGESADAVGAPSARAAKELWKMWPEVVSSGHNVFREEVW